MLNRFHRLPSSLTLALGLTLALAGCKKSGDAKPASTGSTKPPPAAPVSAPTPPATPPADHPPEHHDEGGEGAAEPATVAPTRLGEAGTMIEAAAQELAAIVRDGDLAKAHVVADRLAKLGAALPALATKAGLGADDVKAVTIAGKKLGLLFGDMDEAGDGGKRDEAQAVFARYGEPLATIKAKTAGSTR